VRYIFASYLNDRHGWTSIDSIIGYTNYGEGKDEFGMAFIIYSELFNCAN
jgi:hypothetical protein